MSAAPKFATYQDLLEAPAHSVAELVHGILHSVPRPSPKHANTAIGVTDSLRGPFGRGRGGPGGWIILIEPELHLDADVLVPDIAGWRRERLPQLPDTAFVEMAPDWICEVLSPSTARFDRTVKLPRYAEAGVSFAWLIDPATQTLEVYERNPHHAGARWLLLGAFGGDDQIRPVPFDAVPFELADLWAQ